MSKIHDYINNNLIAYIGNKRRLISLIEKSIKNTGILTRNKNPKFLDLFAGTGVVSRLAKSMGFEVYSNDWEYYSYIINKAFIELDEKFLENSFAKFGGIDKVIKILNNLNEPKEKDRYISLYYCPDNDENPDIKNERLFYTSYNGKKIDAIRAKIEEWVFKKEISKKEEFLLMALLLYEASTRSNTSGVFKGFHKGFGGTNGDALTRILKLINFKRPILINGKSSRVFREDAVKLVEFFREKEFDIVYLDPPYNQHQYGSNYHLLNTIALNDKPIINKNIFINGKKTNKSAIRPDWIKTKSNFCYKKSAVNDFKQIIDNINSNYILLSYSSDGIIPFDEILDILITKGKTDIILSEYVKYRGGKQSLTTEVKNIEFVLIVNTKERGSKQDIINIKKKLLIKKLKLFIKKTINPIRAESLNFINVKKSFKEGIVTSIYKIYGGNKVIFNISENKIMSHNLNFKEIYKLHYEILKNIFDDLEYLTNLTKDDEIYLILNEIKESYKLNLHKKSLSLFKNIPYLLSKYNNKKAYIASLKTIINILDILIQTLNMWEHLDLLKLKSYKKFELILFKKLNYKEFKKSIENENNNFLNYEKNIDTLKKQICSLYEYFMNKMTENTKQKSFKIKDIELLIIKSKKQSNKFVKLQSVL